MGHKWPPLGRQASPGPFRPPEASPKSIRPPQKPPQEKSWTLFRTKYETYPPNLEHFLPKQCILTTHPPPFILGQCAFFHLCSPGEATFTEGPPVLSQPKVKVLIYAGYISNNNQYLESFVKWCYQSAQKNRILAICPKWAEFGLNFGSRPEKNQIV